MNLAYTAYAGLSAAAFLSIYPYYWIKTRSAGPAESVLSQRMGHYSNEQLASISGAPRIWLHAVSVGEVRAAQAVIGALLKRLPRAAIILSTTTTHGQQAAREALGEKVTCVFAPLDFPCSVRSALLTIRPQVLVCLETEIWPNWLMTAHRLNIPTAIVNGRISARSIRAYRKVKALMQPVLESMAAFSMIHTSDAQRLLQLGAPEGKISVNGNSKFDLLIDQIQNNNLESLEKLYGIKKHQKVIVAGSIRGNEPDIILNAYRQVVALYPDALLIIAPRHVDRAAEIKATVLSKGFTCRLRTELEAPDGTGDASVIVVDIMGELQSLYGMATIVFCGGSLAPFGGQNILEAAAWGKPVLYGPSMEDFPDARELLEKADGAAEVANEQALTEKMLFYLSNPDAAAALGDRAGKAALSCQGASEKHASVICDLLSSSGR